MSQHWHGHWTEYTFTPKRLRNWEVPKWYPSWPDKHCITTKFITDDNGRILDNANKAKHSPWEIYKGTWDLPKRITKSIATELSTTPQYKKDLWELHKKRNECLCKKIEQAKKKRKKEVIDTVKDTAKPDQIEETQETSTKNVEKDEEDNKTGLQG